MAPNLKHRSARILVLSASTRGGSWRWIEEVIVSAQAEQGTAVVAYGDRSEVRGARAGSLTAPFIPYETVGLWMNKRLELVLLFNIPLVFFTYVGLLRWRPRIVLANGVLLAAICAPYVLLTGAKLIVAYHGYLGGHPGWILSALRILLRPVACAFANSSGSRADLSRVLDPGRVLCVEHWADDVYFEQRLWDCDSIEPIRVLYVGRQDAEKIGFLLEVIAACSQDVIHFEFVGGGPLAGRIKALEGTGRITHHDYVDDKSELAKIYSRADVLWGVADETYVAKPVVEALACGTPVVIPDTPAVSPKVMAGIKIPRSLIPDSVGAIVDGTDVQAARLQLLEFTLRTPGLRRAQAEACRDYARKHYSKKNLAPVVDMLGGA